MYKYKFKIYQYGQVINIIKTNSYKKAQRIFYEYYHTFDYACVPFIDDKEVRFMDAYDYFNLKDIRRKYLPHSKSSYFLFMEN